jgi:signal transduction histidine kinase
MNATHIQVLLIDDDEDQFHVVRKYLNRAGPGEYTVEWASTMDEAFAVLEKGMPQVCLLDYHLGEITGIELLGTMRERGFEQPVILLTGQGSLAIDVDAMEHGVSDYLDKNDLNPVLLDRSIRYTLENYRARAELKKLNEELEARVRERTAELNRSNQELEQFANMVAHDLKEPLRALNTQIETLRKNETQSDKDTAKTAHRLLDPVLHATGNIALLVQNLLDASRAGQGVSHFEKVDLNKVAGEAWTNLADAATGTGATLEVQDLPHVRGDSWQLLGLFNNLLDNALKFHGNELPKIEIRAERQGEQWLIAVKDNGIGIDEEDEEEVFIMFGGKTEQREMMSAGIGLPICRKIVQHHGGRIWIDSDPGKGTTFFFTLPGE